MRRNYAAGIRQEQPALTVRATYIRCGDRMAVDEHVIGDFDTLPRKCCDSLDQRRNTTGTQPSAQVSAPPRLFKNGCRGRA